MSKEKLQLGSAIFKHIAISSVLVRNNIKLNNNNKLKQKKILQLLISPCVIRQQ
jgi:hypothetical protein